MTLDADKAVVTAVLARVVAAVVRWQIFVSGLVLLFVAVVAPAAAAIRVRRRCWLCLLCLIRVQPISW